VGLAQAELERAGIVTASITMLPEITEHIGVCRSLEVPFPLGFPLGEANNRALQREVLEQLLELTVRDDMPVAEPLRLRGAGIEL
jgi:hypothetical protein